MAANFTLKIKCRVPKKQQDLKINAIMFKKETCFWFTEMPYIFKSFAKVSRWLVWVLVSAMGWGHLHSLGKSTIISRGEGERKQRGGLDPRLWVSLKVWQVASDRGLRTAIEKRFHRIKNRWSCRCRRCSSYSYVLSTQHSCIEPWEIIFIANVIQMYNVSLSSLAADT